MMAEIRKFRLTILSLLGILLPSAAWSDGDDFFQPANAPLASQLVFVGVVKDQAGGFIYGALVTWQATSVDGSGERSSTAGTFTNLLGRYRTVDIARVVAVNDHALDPGRVELTVAKPGYVMVRRLKRSRLGEGMGLQEIDFIMAKVGASESR